MSIYMYMYVCVDTQIDGWIEEWLDREVGARLEGHQGEAARGAARKSPAVCQRVNLWLFFFGGVAHLLADSAQARTCFRLNCLTPDFASAAVM